MSIAVNSIRQNYSAKCGIITMHAGIDNIPVITSANSTFYDIISYSIDEFHTLFNDNFFLLINEDERDDVILYVSKRLRDEKSFSLKICVNGKNATIIPLLISGHSVGDGSTWISIFEDSFNKDIDELTGLYSISKFQREAYKLLSSGKEERYIVLSTDFEKFKITNEHFGYEEGNRILVAFASMLKRLLCPGEFSCRYYADRFLTFIRYCEKDELIDRFSKLEDELEALQAENKNGYSLSITTGIYYVSPEEDDVISVIDKANIARKTAKGSHKTSFVVYNREIKNRLELETDIETKMDHALKKHEFAVYFQAKINLSTEKIVGAEALVRWIRPDGKIIQPGSFIPLFEKNGFIITLDFYVYDAVLRTLAEWKKLGVPLIPISVNVSPLHFISPDFVSKFNELVDFYEIDHSLIELELTESTMINDMTYVSSVMRSLKDLGYILSIDDFGSGYSSLNVLRELPADILKLDKDFFKDRDVNKKAGTIVSYVIHMAKELDLKVLSEGVETVGQKEFLKINQCDMAQGFLFSRPMPIDDFVLLLQKQADNCLV